MNLIVAVSKNWAIGKGNKLLFSIPEDMQFFKKMTLGKVVLMGYNTFLSLPKQQPLKDRVNIVLAPSGVAFDGVTVVNTLEELFSEVKKYNEDENTFETRFMLQFTELFPKDMKYFLGQNFVFDKLPNK